MDQWQQFRKSALAGLEGAKMEGKADKRAFLLMDAINKNPAYATTSSCSGRVMLLSLQRHKKDAKMEGRWHGRIAWKEIRDAVESYGGNRSLWLKLEPFILHVACRDIDAGMGLLRACKDAGVKRFGLQAMKGGKRCLVEIIGTGKMDIPLGACAVDYAKFAKLANSTMAQNWKRMEALRQRIVQGLSE
jgi:tRNA wybutosine-synthesizing protein 3